MNTMRRLADRLAKSKPARYALLHAPLAVLCLTAAATFLTSRSADISLAEGESITLAGLFARVGAGEPETTDSGLRLKKFEIVRRPDPDGSLLTYRSTLGLTAGGQEREETVAVNQPLSLGPVSLHQKAWSVGLKVGTLDVAGTRYEFQDRLSVDLKDGRILLVRPEGFDRELVYRWKLVAGPSGIGPEGLFSKGSIPPELSAYRIAILEEKIAFVSVLQASYKPWGPTLAVTAVLTLLALGPGLWMSGRIGSRPKSA